MKQLSASKIQRISSDTKGCSLIEEKNLLKVIGKNGFKFLHAYNMFTSKNKHLFGFDCIPVFQGQQGKELKCDIHTRRVT